MKRIVGLFIILAQIASVTHAQNLDWIGQFTSEQGVSPLGLSIDDQGNIYICGNNAITADLDPGSGVFESTGGSFVAKMDSNGDLIWAQSFESISIGEMAVDGSGNVILGFNHFDTADFNPGAEELSFTAQGFGDIILVRLMADGSFDWALQLGGEGSDNIYGLDAESDGTICISGTFQETVDFEPGTETLELNAVGSSDVYVAKLTSSGDLIWARSFGGSGFDYSNDLEVDVSGQLYLHGEFSGTVDLDPGTGVFELSSTGASDVFVSKLDESGDLIWAGNIGGESLNMPSSMDLGLNDELHIVGWFSDTVDLDPGSGTNEFTSTGNQSSYLCQLNASTGDLIWAKSFDSTNRVSAIDVAIDNEGNVFTVGSFSGDGDFESNEGGVVLNGTNSFDDDIFICRLNSDGDYACARSIMGPDSELAYHIELTSSGEQVITGIFESTVDFDPGPDSFELTQQGDPAPLSDNEADTFIIQVDVEECLDVGIEGFNNKNDISLFPNPTSGQVTINLQSKHSNIEVRIKDITGQLLSTLLHQNKSRISFNLNEVSGVYIIELVADNARAVYRVIRE